MTGRRMFRRADYEALTHLTPADAARKLGVSVSSVHAMARRHGLTFSSGPMRKLADYQALTHMSRAEAARELGVGLGAVKAMVNRYGLRFADEAAVAAAPAKVAPRPRVALPPLDGAAAADASGLAPAMCAAPAWSDLRDGRILASKGSYRAVSKLSQEWGLPIAKVMARWHVLRAAR